MVGGEEWFEVPFRGDDNILELDGAMDVLIATGLYP